MEWVLLILILEIHFDDNSCSWVFVHCCIGTFTKVKVQSTSSTTGYRPSKCMIHSLPSALSVWVCTRSFRYADRALGTQYRTVRGNHRQWRLWIYLRLRASGHAATATCGPSRRAVPRMKIRPLWTQTHHHPPLQATATAPTPVSTSEDKVGQSCWR